MESIRETNTNARNDNAIHPSTSSTPPSMPSSNQAGDQHKDVFPKSKACSCKSKRKQSCGWARLVKIKSESKGEVKVICNYCHASISCSTSTDTSAMLNHLGGCKKYPFNKEKQQKTLEDSKDEGSVAHTFDQGNCRGALSKMIIIDELPFKFVEREGFHDFCRFMQPRFIIPARLTIATDCYELFLEKKKKLKSVFSKLSSHISFSTSIWTSCQNLNYMCLTAHFIDDNWKLHKKIINFFLVSSHEGMVIGQAIERCLLDWGIDKVLTLAVENVSSNDLGIAHLQKKLNDWKGSILQAKHLHMRCATHILSLIVKDGLKEIDESINRIRFAIKYVRSSSARLQRFKACVEEEKIISQNSVCLDVEIMWNTTYLMLETAIKFQKAFELLKAQDVEFNKELAKKGVPVESDWEYAQSLLPFLKIFYEATLRLSSSLYNTGNMYMEEIYGLGMVISKYCSSENTRIKLMAKTMKAKYDKYWANIDKINEMIFIATIFDPRYKMDFVTWVINVAYSKEDASKLEGKVKTTLASMYEFYASSHPSTNSQSNNLEQVSDMEFEDILTCGNYMDILYKKQKRGQEAMEKKTELDRYLQEECEDFNNKSFDVLNWWKVNASRYRVLSCMARDVLAIPVSAIASESAFSVDSLVLDSFQSSLTPKIVEALICGQDWLRTSRNPIYSEESLDEIEKIESELPSFTQEHIIDMTMTK